MSTQESESERLRCAAELQLETEKASALESLVVHLRQAADQRRLLERQHAQALEEVRVARATAATCTGTRADATYLHTIQGLESKVWPRRPSSFPAVLFNVCLCCFVLCRSRNLGCFVRCDNNRIVSPNLVGFMW